MAVAKQSIVLLPRTLADAGLAGAAALEFKSDQRSRVWQVDKPDRAVVVKQFVYSPLRQKLAMAIGNHPAQRELRSNAALREAGIAVVPIMDGGVDAGQVWLATPCMGQSLLRCLWQGENLEALIDAAAAVTAQLMDAGYTFKDLKPSNMVVDSTGKAQLIDVGPARKSTKNSDIRRMMGVMDRTLARDGVEPKLRERFAAKAVAGVPSSN